MQACSIMADLIASINCLSQVTDSPLSPYAASKKVHVHGSKSAWTNVQRAFVNRGQRLCASHTIICINSIFLSCGISQSMVQPDVQVCCQKKKKERQRGRLERGVRERAKKKKERKGERAREAEEETRKENGSQ